jgi:hypothetical protein
MSSCSLEVELDEPERSYRCGDTVTGRVRVRTDGEVTCTKLVVEQVWRTHGRGNLDTGTLHEHVTTDQRWLPGQAYEVPFAFAAPAGPVSYRGHLVCVDHYVAARADLPWKVDPRAQTDYLVVAGAETEARYLATKADFDKTPGAEAVAQKPKQRSIGGLLMRILTAPLWIALLAVVVVLVLAALVFILPIALVVFLVRLVRQSSAERRLGAVEVQIEAPQLDRRPDDRASGGTLAGVFGAVKRRLGRLGGQTYLAAPGRSIPVRLRFQPKGEVAIERATLEVRATESARSGSGTNATTHTHEVHEQQVELSGPRRLTAGHPVELQGTIELPPDAPASFRASDNSVTWEMKIAIEIAQWPDWVQKSDLLVVPAA